MSRSERVTSLLAKGASIAVTPDPLGPGYCCVVTLDDKMTVGDGEEPSVAVTRAISAMEKFPPLTKIDIDGMQIHNAVTGVTPEEADHAPNQRGWTVAYARSARSYGRGNRRRRIALR